MQTTTSTSQALIISLLVVGFHAHVNAADPAAVTEIRKLGGQVRLMARDADQWRVQFHLGGQELTDAGLAHVAALGDVVSLNLRDTNITSAGLVHLKDMTKLRHLHLERTAIDDAGIRHLVKLTNLEYLNLYSTGITDDSLAMLAGLKKLKRLFVWQTGVTDAGVARINKALPELLIDRGVDLSKLPTPPPAKPLVPLKWIAASNKIPQKSQTGSSTSVTFMNKSKIRLKLFWIGYDGVHKLYAEIDSGATHVQNTYSNAIWLITDVKDKPLGYFVAVPEDARANITAISDSLGR